MRLITTKQVGDRVAKIYRDAEWNEYRVVFFFAGVKQVDADYHTGDYDDAEATALTILNTVTS